MENYTSENLQITITQSNSNYYMKWFGISDDPKPEEYLKVTLTKW